MDISYWQNVDKHIKAWIKEAGSMLHDSFHKKLDINYKTGYDDLVTNMDKEIEQFFINKKNEVFPDHHVVSEEGFGDKLESEEGIIWLLDPIDGTMNFVHQQRHFAISIGIFENGEERLGLIYDVVADDLYHCIKGQGAYLNDIRLSSLETSRLEEAIIGVNATWVLKNRRIDPQILQPVLRKARGSRSYGSAALELAYVAAGKMDCYISMRLNPWDYGAGIILIKEVGGVTTTILGEKIKLLEKCSIFAASPSIHKIILEEHVQKGIDEGLFVEQNCEQKNLSS